MYTLNFNKVLQGQTFLQDIYFQYESGDLFPLENCVPKAQIRAYPGASELVAEISCTLDAENSRIHMELTQDQTRAIPAGVYYYDFCLQDDYGITYYLEGKFIVRKSVTVV